MTRPAIVVENLSKKFRIGTGGGPGYHRLSEMLTGLPRFALQAAQRSFRSPRPESSEAANESFGSPRPAAGRGAGGEGQSSEFWALRDVSFEVQPGEVVGIIGRNGAGKSTLLKILSRITEPTSGRFGVRGRVASLLEVGTGFHPELTGRENIYVSGITLGMTRAEIKKRFDEIVDFSGVEKFLDTPVKHYSSGMQVRLGFAVAAHLQSEVLIIDEILAVGDVTFQKKCLSRLSVEAGSGRTILFVSHNLNAVERLCTSVIRLDQGNLVDAGQNVARCISNYMKNNVITDLDLSRSWDNYLQPHHATIIRPIRFSLSSFGADSRVGNQFSNAAPIVVSIEVEFTTRDPGFNLGIAAYDMNGQLLFYSFFKDLDEEQWPSVTPGHRSYRIELPKRLLNEGEYRIELIAGIHAQEWYLEPDQNAPALLFEIFGGLSDSPIWESKRAGTLAPTIRWDNDS